MKTFPILYKRTKTGAIQYWKIEVEDPIRPVTDGDWAFIRKESGQLGTTSPVRHSEKITEGKQKRSYIEQAIAMAESDWKKKQDEGYKTLISVGVETVTDEAWTGERYMTTAGWMDLSDALDRYLPESNTDASGNVKPMLATDWKKIKKVEYPCIVEPKLDGVRCLLIVSGEEGMEVKFLSRSGKEYLTLGHIEADVFSAWDPGDRIHEPFILDGEIYSNELTFQEIVQATKKQCSNCEKLHFRAYDVVNEEPMKQRRATLRDLVERIDSRHIQLIQHDVANNEKEVLDYHNNAVQNGYEGAMLRLFDGKYEQGHRSRNLLKVKEFDEVEYAAVGMEFGQRGVEDLLFLCKTIDGQDFKAKMQGTREQKQTIYNELKEVDMIENNILVTVKHFGFTTDRIPRFPVAKAIRDYE